MRTTAQRQRNDIKNGLILNIKKQLTHFALAAFLYNEKYAVSVAQREYSGGANASSDKQTGTKSEI